MESVYCHVYILPMNLKIFQLSNAKELLNLQVTAGTLISLKLQSAWDEAGPGVPREQLCCMRAQRGLCGTTHEWVEMSVALQLTG